VFAGLLAWGLWGLPAFGHYAGPYGDILNHQATPRRHATNVVSSINYDYRGLDTMGEEFILFTSIAGLALLLREMRKHGHDAGLPPPTRQPSDAIRLFGYVLSGVIILFGIYIVVHGQLTPGGGFQGGVLLGTSCLLAFLATDYQTFVRVSPHALLHAGDSIGAGAYALIGLATVACGGMFLQNLLPLGKTGTMLSAGTIPVINFFVGLEVAAGFALLFVEFVKQTESSE
jgi:multicomponent Na+:H+ antiporter subunit B